AGVESASEVRAEPEVASAKVTTTPARGGLELNGFARATTFVQEMQGHEDSAELQAAYSELSLKLRARFGSDGDAFAELRTATGTLWGERFSRTVLREAYANFYAGPLDLRVGHQIIVWGRADGINPTNNLTPQDMSTRSADEDDMRKANLAARAFLNFQPIRLEMVWVPFYAPSELPPFELPGNLILYPQDEPDLSLSKGIGALKVHYEGGAFEGSVSFLAGHATMPGLRYLDHEVAMGEMPTVDVQLAAYRQIVVGADFATTLGDSFGLRGEAAYRQAIDYEEREDVPLPDLRYVLGVDKEIVTDLSLLLQYVGTYVTEWRDTGRDAEFGRILASDEMPTMEEIIPFVFDLNTLIPAEVYYKNRVIYGQQEKVSHAAMGRLGYAALYDTLHLDLVGYYGFTYEDYMVRAKATYDFADELQLILGASVFGGPDETLYGMIKDTMTAAFVEARASF
ncbi:hypothetical protein KAI87_04110, partial [Myxococcota bacterium]|nr:hypothetical protein [Myxococcota bacterium]